MRNPNPLLSPALTLSLVLTASLAEPVEPPDTLVSALIEQITALLRERQARRTPTGSPSSST